MKKSILLVAAVVLSAGILIACEKNKPTAEPTATPTVAPTETSTPTPAPTNTSTPTPTVAPTSTPTVAPTATPTPEPTKAGWVVLTEKETVAVTDGKQSALEKYGQDSLEYETYTKRFDMLDADNQVKGYILITYDQFKDDWKKTEDTSTVPAFCTRYELYFEGEKCIDIYADIQKDNDGFYSLNYKGSAINGDIIPTLLVYKSNRIDAGYLNMKLTATGEKVTVSNSEFSYTGYTSVEEDRLVNKQPTNGDEQFQYIIYPASGDRQTVYCKLNAYGHTEGWENYVYSNFDLYQEYKNPLRAHSFSLADGSRILDCDELFAKYESTAAAAKKAAYETLLSRAADESGEIELKEVIAEDAYGKLELITKALLYKGADGKNQVAGQHTLVYTVFNGGSYKWESYIASELPGSYLVDGDYTYIISEVDTQLDTPVVFFDSQYCIRRNVKITAYSAEGVFAGSYEADYYPLSDYTYNAKYNSLKLLDENGSTKYEKTEATSLAEMTVQAGAITMKIEQSQLKNTAVTVVTSSGQSLCKRYVDTSE